jgi:Rieske Fe-S protein
MNQTSSPCPAAEPKTAQSPARIQETAPCEVAAISRRVFLERALGSVAGAAAFAMLTSCVQADENDAAAAEGKGAPIIATKRDDGSWLLAGGAEVTAGNSLAFLFGVKEAPGILLALPNDDKAKADAPPQLVALSTVCTHAGCTVAWQAENKLLDCPCHHSRFDTAGQVLKGPAKKPLPLYSVRREGADAILTPA